MFHMVTAVVQDNIYASYLLNDRLQKIVVNLRADSYLPSQTVKLLAHRVDVNTENNGIIAKVLSPHLKTAAFTYANLKKSYFAPSKG